MVMFDMYVVLLLVYVSYFLFSLYIVCIFSLLPFMVNKEENYFRR